jgi:hypothetical protein
MRFLLIAACILVPSSASAAFSDVPKTHPHYDAINYVQSEGIVEGYSNGTYGPDKTINRAEFVKILVNVYTKRIDDLYAKNPDVQQPEDTYCINFFNNTDEQLPLTDVAKDVWYAASVCSAISQDLIDGYPDGTFRPSNQINFVESAKILMNAFGLHTDVVYKGPWYELPVTMLQNQNAIPLSITRFDQPITRGEMAEMVYRLKTMNTEKESRTYADMQS